MTTSPRCEARSHAAAARTGAKHRRRSGPMTSASCVSPEPFGVVSSLGLSSGVSSTPFTPYSSQLRGHWSSGTSPAAWANVRKAAATCPRS